jgi:serine/threonine protein kinase
MIGKTVLHYEILEELGRGGMGVVYLAEDAKLRRNVALKFLPADALPDQTDKERFVREAQAAAALSHPNIAHIYAIEEFEDKLFIAMEYIDGQTLQDRLSANGGRPLPIDMAIDVVSQIAAGLQAAHEKGIVHRDVKSANVMITDKGLVKIMDFGLAKLSNRTKMTMQGSTLGTVAYMSPEQAQGQEIDHRSDIWSLGVVFYETISGQLPFKGDYEQAVIYAILHDEPDPLTAMRSGLPIALDGVISKSISKDIALRYQHVDELPADLKGIYLQSTNGSRISAKSRSAGTDQRLRSSGKISWSVALLIAIFAACLASLLVWNLKNIPERQEGIISRWKINLPSEMSLGRGITIAQDGKQIIFKGYKDDRSQLYIRHIDKFTLIPIPGTEDASEPFLSPEGDWIGFVANGKLMKVSLAGGSPVYMCDVQTTMPGAAWWKNRKNYATESCPW